MFSVTSGVGDDEQPAVLPFRTAPQPLTPKTMRLIDVYEKHKWTKQISYRHAEQKNRPERFRAPA